MSSSDGSASESAKVAGDTKRHNDSARHDDREEPVVITDKRKIDRSGEAAAAPEPDVDLGGAPALDENAVLLVERTADLQRVQAEYANYRKRADRDRQLAGDVAVSRVLVDLLPVLDNLERAKAHGDLTGGLKAVADQLDGVFDKLGLVSFGEVGDLFDPSVHEAVLHDESEAVDEPTCTTVMRPGYKHHDRLLRPAMVGVSDPVHGKATATAAESLETPEAPESNKQEETPSIPEDEQTQQS